LFYQNTELKDLSKMKQELIKTTIILLLVFIPIILNSQTAMATHVGCMNRCAVRSFLVNETFEGSFIFPITEDYNWTKWSESNIIKVSLNKEMQKLSLIYIPKTMRI